MFRPETLRAGIRWFLALLALAAAVTPAGASAWSYGCKGVLPVFNDSETITFNRMSLLLLPKSYIKGTLRDLFVHDAVDDVLEVAKAVDINSGLAPSMAFTSLEHPDQKLTLTEKSSKTLSDVRERAGSQPRYAQTTTYSKVYHYVSDFGFAGPFDVKMDCMSYELSAPVR